MDHADQPNYKRLRLIQIIAVTDGILVSLVALYLMAQFSKPELAPLVI